MYKRISLLLIATLLIGCSSGFKIIKFTDYSPPGEVSYHNNNPIIYSQSRVNKIKSNNEYYIEIAIISGHNGYGTPQFDEVFKQRLNGICNELGGDMILYELDKSIPKDYNHVYTIVKRCYSPECVWTGK